MKTKFIQFVFAIYLSCLTTACVQNKVDKDVVQRTYMHKYGVPIGQKEWKEFGKNGQIITVLKSGVTVAKSYENGILNGKTTYSFPYSETIEKVELYENAQLIKETHHYATGTPKWEIHYLPDEAKSVTNWFESTTPQSKELYKSDLLETGKYYNDVNELESRVDEGNGARIQRDSQGTLVAEDTIENGVMVLQSRFYPNGDPKSITPYQKGVVHGERKTYLVGGVPNTIEQWENDKQHGLTVTFRNGEKYSSLFYVNGKKHGLERRYADNGEKVVEEITWHQNIKHGPVNLYPVDGKKQIDWYYKGRLVNKMVFDDLSEHVR